SGVAQRRFHTGGQRCGRTSAARSIFARAQPSQSVQSGHDDCVRSEKRREKPPRDLRREWRRGKKACGRDPAGGALQRYLGRPRRCWTAVCKRRLFLPPDIGQLLADSKNGAAQVSASYTRATFTPKRETAWKSNIQTS